MKATKTYLKGKSIFIVSLIVITVTTLTVYFTGQNFNRSITSNFYISLSIIGISLFLFMTYGLYKGAKMSNDFPEFKDFKTDNFISGSGELPNIDMPSIDLDGFGGIIVSIVLWIVMSIVVFVLLIVLEAVFWFSIFIIFTILYWVFFRALRLVFSSSNQTKGDLLASVKQSFSYTIFYLGWMYGIVYLVQKFQ